MDTNFVNPKRTICEVHREISRKLGEIRLLFIKDSPGDRQAIAAQDLVSEAYEMAKKMDARLREYHNDAVRRERTESR